MTCTVTAWLSWPPALVSLNAHAVVRSGTMSLSPCVPGGCIRVFEDLTNARIEWLFGLALIILIGVDAWPRCASTRPGRSGLRPL